MANIEVRERSVYVRLRGWDKLRALRSSLRVPLSHISGVRTHPREAHFDEVIVDSWRGVGTYRPGTMAVGTVFLRDGRSFFDVHHAENVLALDLTLESLHHIVVEIDGEPVEATAERIWRALGSHIAWASIPT